MTKTALVCGAGGFIGSHLVKRLKSEGYIVTGVDLKYPEFSKSPANYFYIADLRIVSEVNRILDYQFDEVYQLAADMGGAGFVFTGAHDADIMHNSVLININIAKRAVEKQVGKLFFSSSACMYPAYNQKDSLHPTCVESSAYPAAPDSEYGWEKVFSERLYLATQRNYGLDVRIARFHNIFGPEGTWRGGREKSPAAICRKVIEADLSIEVWGDGEQTRSFLYIDECIEGIRRLMNAPTSFEPLNIGSEEMVTINQLARMAMVIGDKHLTIDYIDGPLGVRGRNSNNKLIQEKLGWQPNYPLVKGLEKTYAWIYTQVHGK